MGGSGGGGGFIPRNIKRLVQRARDADELAAFELDVSEYLAEELAQYNDRDVERINRILERVVEELAKDIEGSVDVVFGGSVAKHTFVDGISDIDSLVLIPQREAEGKSPAEIRKLFADRLAARFGRERVVEGHLSVTLKMEGQEIQLLPAIRRGAHYEIASPDAREWLKIRPRAFAKSLTRANQNLDGKLIPAVKLAKAVIANLPDQRRLSGYHTEALALEVFKSYDGPRTAKSLLTHFFEKAGQLVRKPLKDVTGQSKHLDAYLGASDSLQRRAAADSLDRIARRIKTADAAHSSAHWKQLFDRPAE